MDQIGKKQMKKRCESAADILLLRAVIAEIPSRLKE